MGRLICVITGCGQVPCNSHEVASGEGNSSTAFWILPSLCLVEDLESKGPHFPNALGHRIFFFSFLQSIVFLLTLSGSPTPLPSSVAAVSLIKWDRHQWHFLLSSPGEPVFWSVCLQAGGPDICLLQSHGWQVWELSTMAPNLLKIATWKAKSCVTKPPFCFRT